MNNQYLEGLGIPMVKAFPRRRKRAQAGFTLIEILVTVVIISVGLLGLAGLQNRGLQDNKNAILRSLAVQSAADLLDRIRANRDNSASYVIALATNPTKPTGTPTIAQWDLYQWKTGLSRNLPSGNGSVAVASNIVTVVVRWREAGWTQAADDQVVTMETRL